MTQRTRYRLFLVIIAILGSVLVWLVTSKYGPGLSTDGARYLSTAENIVAGEGIIDYLGLPLVNWPPLYPILIATISLLSGWDVFIAGQIVNILAFGSIIYLSGVFFERSLPGNWGFAVVASLIVATSLPLLEVSANISSDPLFMVTVLVFLIVAHDFAKSPSRDRWLLLAGIAIASCFLRYAGLALIFSGVAITFMVWRTSLKRAFSEAAAFGLVAGIPIAAWAIFHNLPATGTLLGSHRPSDVIGNLVAAIEKVMGWFVPETILVIVPPVVIAALLLLVLLVLGSKIRWVSWINRILSPEILPSTAFFAIYGAMLVFAISYSEHRVPGSQRIHAVILPMLLALVSVTAHEFAPKLKAHWRTILLAVFSLWLLFPIYRVVTYVSASMQAGDISYYNLYNTGTLKESDIVAELGSIDLAATEKVYSNNEAAAWFYLRRQVDRLPRYDAELGEDLETAITGFTGWPIDSETATLIWFERELDYKELVPTPEQLQQFIRLTPVFIGRYGDIYLMDVDLK